MLVAESSGSMAVTTGTQLVDGPAYLCGVLLTAGSAAGTVSVYDGKSTSGKLLFTGTAAISTSLPVTVNFAVIANTGLYVVVSGTGATAVIHYSIN